MKIQGAVDSVATPKLALNTKSGGVNTITIDPSEDDYWVLDWVVVSFNEAQTTARLVVRIAGVDVFDAYLMGSLTEFFNFDMPIHDGVKNQELEVSVVSPTGASKLNIRYR